MNVLQTETAAATVVVVVFVKTIVIDMIGNVLSDRFERLFQRHWRRHILFVHGFEHVQKGSFHQPRNPMKCRDGDCAKLESARAARHQPQQQ